MKRTALVRYGEISLKSNQVRKKFEKILIDNIKSSLKEIQHQIIQERGRIFLKTKKPRKVAERIAKLPGIVSTSPTWQTKATMKKIRNTAKEIIEKKFPETGSFAINARRVGEHEYTSEEIEEKIGSYTQEKKPNLRVDLDSPDYELFIEVRKEKAYLFTEKFSGTGGLPVGSQEKVIVPFVNEVDSSVLSTYLLLKRGSPAIPLFFKTEDSPIEKQHRVVKDLKKFHPDLEFGTLEIKHIIDEIPENLQENLEKIIKYRILLKLGEKVANKLGAEAIIMSENLEETKDLSLHNLKIIQNKISIPILNPLLGLDKSRIEKIKKRIGTFTNGKNLVTPSLSSFRTEKMGMEKVQNLEKEIRKKPLMKRTVKTLEIQKLGD